MTFGIWIARASREPNQLSFIMQTIQTIDRRVANPCYVLLLITGGVMVFLAPIPLTTPWLLSSLVLYVIATYVGIFAYAPIFRRQILLLEKSGFKSPEYQAVAKQSRLIGILVSADVILIILLMVVKPALWG